MKKLFAVSGFSRKEKKEDIAYCVAENSEDAVKQVSAFFDNAQWTGKEEALGSQWANSD